MSASFDVDWLLRTWAPSIGGTTHLPPVLCELLDSKYRDGYPDKVALRLLTIQNLPDSVFDKIVLSSNEKVLLKALSHPQATHTHIKELLTSSEHPNLLQRVVATRVEHLPLLDVFMELASDTDKVMAITARNQSLSAIARIFGRLLPAMDMEEAAEAAGLTKLALTDALELVLTYEASISLLEKELQNAPRSPEGAKNMALVTSTLLGSDLPQSVGIAATMFEMFAPQQAEQAASHGIDSIEYGAMLQATLDSYPWFETTHWLVHAPDVAKPYVGSVMRVAGPMLEQLTQWAEKQSSSNATLGFKAITLQMAQCSAMMRLIDAGMWPVPADLAYPQTVELALMLASAGLDVPCAAVWMLPSLSLEFVEAMVEAGHTVPPTAFGEVASLGERHRDNPSALASLLVAFPKDSWSSLVAEWREKFDFDPDAVLAAVLENYGDDVWLVLAKLPDSSASPLWRKLPMRVVRELEGGRNVQLATVLMELMGEASVQQWDTLFSLLSSAEGSDATLGELLDTAAALSQRPSRL